MNKDNEKLKERITEILNFLKIDYYFTIEMKALDEIARDLMFKNNSLARKYYKAKSESSEAKEALDFYGSALKANYHQYEKVQLDKTKYWELRELFIEGKETNREYLNKELINFQTMMNEYYGKTLSERKSGEKGFYLLTDREGMFIPDGYDPKEIEYRKKTSYDEWVNYRYNIMNERYKQKAKNICSTLKDIQLSIVSKPMLSYVFEDAITNSELTAKFGLDLRSNRSIRDDQENYRRFNRESQEKLREKGAGIYPYYGYDEVISSLLDELWLNIFACAKSRGKKDPGLVADYLYLDLDFDIDYYTEEELDNFLTLKFYQKDLTDEEKKKIEKAKRNVLNDQKYNYEYDSEEEYQIKR